MSTVEVARAFFLRDLRLELSFRSGLVLQVVAALLTVMVLYLVGQSFRNVSGSFLDEYGGSYFAFAAFGVALATFMSQGMTTLVDGLRSGQSGGSLEIVLLSPTRLPPLLFAASLPGYAINALGLGTALAAVTVLGVDYHAAGLPIAALAVVLGTAGFVGLGLVAAALVFVTRRGNPLSWGLRAGSVVLGGVFFPVDQLPAPLWVLAQALPLTHAVEVLRRSLLVGEGLADLWVPLLAATAVAAALLAVGTAACALAVRIARTDGTLTH